MTPTDPPSNRPQVPLGDLLANERTFLAWIRTSLALITFGFVIAKFSVWLRQFAATLHAADPTVTPPRPGASLPAGLLLMAFGAGVALLSLWRHRRVAQALEAGELPHADRMAALVAWVVALVAVALIGFLIATVRVL